MHCLIEGDGEQLRLERMRRALDNKCPKLAVWAADGRRSVLVLEADDIQLSNCWLAYKAFKGSVATLKVVTEAVSVSRSHAATSNSLLMN